MLRTNPVRMFCLCVLSLLLVLNSSSCKRGSRYGRSVDFKGSILFQTPTPSEGSRLNRTLSLKLQLYDANKISHVEVWLANIKRWEKVFVGPKVEEKTITTKIDISNIQDGQHELRVILRDHVDYVTESTRKYWFDHSGPSVTWLAPPLEVALSEKKTVELSVKDKSKIRQVVVYFRDKKLHEFVEPPYEFKIQPADFPSGIVQLRVIATDQLGNSTDKAFTFSVEGSLLGRPCGFMDSCKENLACIRTARAPRGICRQYCRTSRDCKQKKQKCRSVGQRRVCLPKDARLLAGPFQLCGRTLPCAGNLLCIKLPRKAARCHPKCGPGFSPCRTGFKCQKHRGQSVCIPIPPKPGLRKVGQTCSARRQCVKTALCLKLKKNGDSKCYRLCKSQYECRGGLSCLPLPGKQKVCVPARRRRRKAPKQVGMYEKCSSKIPCRRGLMCYGSSAANAMCHPTCTSATSPCTSGAACVGSSAGYICLKPCDPMSNNCPGGLRCKFIRVARGKLQHLCQ